MARAQTRLALIAPMAAAAGILAFGGLAGVQPLLAQADRTRGESRTVHQETAAARAENERLRTQANDLPQLRTAYAGLERQIPASSNATQFLDDITRSAEMAGVQLTGAALSDPTSFDSKTAPKLPKGASGNGLLSVPVTLALVGDEAAFGRFAAQLDRNPRVFSVTSLEGSGTAHGELDTWRIAGLLWTLPQATK